MKTVLYAIALSLVSISANAQQSSDPNIVVTYLDINCFKDITPYTDMLENQYNEKPLFVGRSLLPVANFFRGEPDVLEGILMAYVNQETGTFTNVMLFPDGSGCEVSYGGEFTPVTN